MHCVLLVVEDSVVCRYSFPFGRFSFFLKILAVFLMDVLVNVTIYHKQEKGGMR